jgi:DNA-binding response OmpR family regulator
MNPEAQKILVIDSDSRRRHLSERVLSEEGFAVTAVAEGFSAIRAAVSGRFALAIAAVELPGTLDGLTTVRQIRARQPWLKALFTGDVAERPWWPNPDCEDFIAAPFHCRDLLGCVFELLQREIGRVGPGRDCRDASRFEASLEPMRVVGAAALADLTGCRD